MEISSSQENITQKTPNDPLLSTAKTTKAQTTKRSNFLRVYFYPKKEINHEDWSFFKKTFGIFVLVSVALLLLGLIPLISKHIAIASDFIASNWFGAEIDSLVKTNPFWWQTSFEGLSKIFTVNMLTTGLGLAAFMIALIIATPAEWKKKTFVIIITIIFVYPLNIFRLGFQKWLFWSLANNTEMKTNNSLIYLSLADYLPVLTVVFWLLGFGLLIFFSHKLDVKVGATIFAWLHQIWYFLAGFLGLRKKEKEATQDEPEADSEEKEALNS